MAKRRLPWARWCNKLHSTICIVLLSEFVSQNMWLQQYVRAYIYYVGSLVAQQVKKSTCNAGDLDSMPGLGGSPWEGKDYSLQYFGLEN